MSILNIVQFEMKNLSNKHNEFFEKFEIRFNIYIALLQYNDKNKIH